MTYYFFLSILFLSSLHLSQTVFSSPGFPQTYNFCIFFFSQFGQFILIYNLFDNAVDCPPKQQKLDGQGNNISQGSYATKSQEAIN